MTQTVRYSGTKINGVKRFMTLMFGKNVIFNNYFVSYLV